MKEGWISLHRKILENPIVTKDAEHFYIWVYLLLNATHKDMPVLFEKEKIVLGPGQLVTGTTKIASDTQISRSKVQRILKTFKNDMQIDTQTCSRGTLISIRNWEKYQLDDTESDTRVIRKRYASDTQVSTNNNDNNENNKEIVTKVTTKKVFAKPTVEEVRAYCRERNNGINADSFVDFYESKGWLIGKNKMKDWKAAVRTWERSRKNNERDTYTESFTTFQIGPDD